MAEEAKAVEVVRNEDEERWEADLGNALAVLTYGESEGKLYLLHTEVPPEAEGRGVGSRLVKAALEHARGAGMKVVPLCPFAKAYMQRHRDYDDLLAPRE